MGLLNKLQTLHTEQQQLLRNKYALEIQLTDRWIVSVLNSMIASLTKESRDWGILCTNGINDDHLMKQYVDGFRETPSRKDFTGNMEDALVHMVSTYKNRLVTKCPTTSGAPLPPVTKMSWDYWTGTYGVENNIIEGAPSLIGTLKSMYPVEFKLTFHNHGFIVIDVDLNHTNLIEIPSLL